MKETEIIKLKNFIYTEFFHATKHQFWKNDGIFKYLGIKQDQIVEKIFLQKNKILLNLNL